MPKTKITHLFLLGSYWLSCVELTEGFLQIHCLAPTVPLIYLINIVPLPCVTHRQVCRRDHVGDSGPEAIIYKQSLEPVSGSEAHPVVKQEGGV